MDTTNKKPKVLYVEDDTALSTLYTMRLQSEGYEVIQAYDGDSALQAGRDSRPDLILLDLMMPTLNGFEAIEMFRDMVETKAAAIVVLSALNSKDDVARAIQLGADEYLVKSQVPMNDIVDTVRRHLERVGAIQSSGLGAA